MNANGSANTSNIIPVSTISSEARSLAIQDDGKLILTGFAATASSANDITIARLNTNLNIDNSFGMNGVMSITSHTQNDYAYSSVIQPDGTIAVAGSVTSSGISNYALAFFKDEAVGYTASTKVVPGSHPKQFLSLLQQDDGKLLASGYASDGIMNNIGFARFSSTGVLRPMADGTGLVQTDLGGNGDVARKVIVQPDGKVLAVGQAINGVFGLARYNVDGSLDTSFSSNGRLEDNVSPGTDQINGVAKPDMAAQTPPSMSERDIFTTARAFTDPAVRAAFLADVCARDIAQRDRILRLLDADASTECMLDVPVAQRPDSTTPLFEQEELEKTELFTYLSPSARPDAIGRIGHYEVLEVLGRGGFGVVFRAVDAVLIRAVAIKVLSPELAVTSAARKRFLREAQAYAQVQHENIVQVFGVEEEPVVHLVMEYIPGETLQQRLNRTGPLDANEALKIGQQIAEGLAAAHATRLIHRDIKPSNVLLLRGPCGYEAFFERGTDWAVGPFVSGFLSAIAESGLVHSIGKRKRYVG